MRVLGRLVFALVILGIAGGVGWLVWQRLQQEPADEKKRELRATRAAPVEVAPVRRGRIERRRTISGTLEAPSAFGVAPKIGGRIKRIAVHLGDEVTRNDVVCWLEDDELQQAVRQAEAELTVAEANLTEAEKGLEIAARGLARVETLRGRGITSDVQQDQAIAEKLAKEAAVAVATAQKSRAEAAAESARIRKGYAEVAATWPEGENEDERAAKRIVAARYVDEGDTVAANAPLLRIVQLDPILAVVNVTERDYAHLESTGTVALSTDAYPGEVFHGTVKRISPVFDENTRQARVELEVANEQRRLRPGMFVRATLVLDAADDATIVPLGAVTERGDVPGVFLLDEKSSTVRWQPVQTGIRQGDDVQIVRGALTGRVVTLGQQLVKDGSKVIVPDDARAASPPAGGSE
jgi:multidrug efflux pump subunit AcrA (membrane-fusion protein)